MILDSISTGDIAALCRGSVFLATGGGGDPHVCQLLVERALTTRGPVALAAVETLPDDAWVIPIGEVGAPTVSLEQLPAGDEPVLALDRFERHTGRRASHLVSFEIGGANSVVPLLAASARGIPLVDGDGMGRALPEAQMMTFSIEGVAPTPAVAVDHLGNVVILETTDPVLYELQVRQLAVAMGGMIFTAEHAMTGREARRAIVPGTLSFAVALGRILLGGQGDAEQRLPELAAVFAGSQYGALRPLCTGKLSDLDRRTVGGFDVGELTIAPFDGSAAVTVALRNEYLLARRGEEVLASVPDLLTLLDLETAQPINAERLRYGQRVLLLGIGCPPHYRTAKALARVAPRCFGFDVDYTPLS